MTVQKIWIGSAGPFLYDDDEQQYDDGIAVGSCAGVRATGPMAAGPPIGDGYVARMAEVNAMEDGMCIAINVITALQLDGTDVQYQYRTLYFVEGRLASVSPASGWETVV